MSWQTHFVIAFATLLTLGWLSRRTAQAMLQDALKMKELSKYVVTDQNGKITDRRIARIVTVGVLRNLLFGAWLVALKTVSFFVFLYAVISLWETLKLYF